MTTVRPIDDRLRDATRAAHAATLVALKSAPQSEAEAAQRAEEAFTLATVTVTIGIAKGPFDAP